MTTTTMAEPTVKIQAHPRRGVTLDEFLDLEGMTPEISCDIHRVLYGDGYDKSSPATDAFMRRHRIAWVSLR